MGKVRRLENEKERDGREMYFSKLAPHKSDTQSSREKAVKNGVCAQSQVRADAGSQGKRGGTGQENEEQCIEKRQKGRGVFLDFLLGFHIRNQCMSCIFHAQQPTGRAAVYVKRLM